ncbi:putative acyltransferase [Rhodobacteraceae bacterium HIMB11]|nr:putative acyltransferase [Rhodobacteraceae bacterium HIMB11]
MSLMSSTYDPRITMLRGVAALMVVIYHAPYIFELSKFVKYGYLGVDIFLVLSGYLLAENYIYCNNKSTFNSYVWNRLNRIYPALVVLIILTTIFTYLVLTPIEAQPINTYAIYAVIGLANLAPNAEPYWQINQELRPLAHLWSISIELQCYLLIGAIVFLKNKSKDLILPELIAFTLFTLSTVLSLYEIGIEDNYYQTENRIWQPLLGVLTCFVVKKSDFNFTLLFLVFLFIILWLSFKLDFNVSTNFMGVNSLNFFSAIGTSFLLLLISRSNILLQFCEDNVFTQIGAMSYSIYLYHYPIFIFLTLYSLNPVLSFLLGLTITVILSCTSFIIIEKNKNRIENNLKTHTAILTTLFIVLYFGSLDGHAHRLSLSAKQFLTSPDRQMLFDHNGEECLFRICNFESKISNNQKDKLVLIGDSHAQMISKAFVDRATNMYNITTIISTCFLPDGYELFTKSGTKLNRCSNFGYEQNKYLKNIENSIVVFAVRWPKLIDSSPYNNPFAGKENKEYPEIERLRLGSRDGILDNFRLQIEMILENNNKVYFLNTVPEHGININNMFARKLLFQGGDIIDELTSEYYRGLPITEYLRRNSKIMDFVQNLSITHSGFHVFETKNLFCDTHCRVQFDNNLLYRDDDHLSPYGAQILVSALLKEILPN